MKLIPLTQGLFAQIDDHWFEELNQHKWYAHKEKNMRNCTRQQNGRNICARGKSKYLGVYFTFNTHYIRMSILVGDTRISKGPFKTEEDAARFYDKLAKKYFKEFANLNFK